MRNDDNSKKDKGSLETPTPGFVVIVFFGLSLAEFC